MAKQQKEFITGIDSTVIIGLSEKIREGWNDFFLESRYCQDQIRYGSEEQTNYMGDLLNYFDDTVELLAKIPLKQDYQQALYDTVAVLQLMYVGQDLIDELRTVFKMPKSTGEEKMLIRTLRNELTGHPISRDKGDFVSSVFFTRNSHGDVIEYLRYHRDDAYEAKVVRQSWSDLIRMHENYLLENLKEIISSLKKKLKLYQLQLNKFIESVPKINFEGLVNRTEHLLESFFECSALYSKTNLLYYFERHDVHQRYRICTDRFTNELMAALLQTRENISQFRSETMPIELQVDNTKKTKIVFTNGGGKSSGTPNVKSNMRYRFSKLRERHPIFNIDYFIKEHQSDTELIAELLHMQSVYGDDREFYCSYEYLRHLFISRSLL